MPLPTFFRRSSQHEGDEPVSDGTNDAVFTYEMAPDGTRRDRLARREPN